MVRPNLFVIGYPKSGTTAMYKFLDQHPRISMSADKEPGHLARDEFDEADYLSYFDGLENEWVREATPSYVHSEEALQRLASFNPDARLIVLLREPTDFLLSFREHLNRREEVEVPDVDDLFSGKYDEWIQEWSQYDKDLKTVLSYFPSDQVFICPFEWFKADNQRGMSKVFSFLDLSDYEITTASYNESVRCKLAWVEKLIIRYDLGKLANTLPTKLRDPLVNTMKSVLFKRRNETDVRVYRFKEMVKETQSVLDKYGYEWDLVQRWGYR